MCTLNVKSIILCFCAYQVCGNLQVPLIMNTKLALNYVLETVFSGKLHRCADKCVYKTDCLSVSFSWETKVCEMYRINSTSAGSGDKITKRKTVLVDIERWPPTRTGACWNKPCAEKMKCVPHGVSYRCQLDEENGCKPYVLPENGRILDIYGHLALITGELNPIGTAIALNCKEPYFTYLVDPDIYWLSRCQTNQKWSKHYFCFTVEELCLLPILEYLYPTYVNITATSAVSEWSETDLFLSSLSGWIPATNDGQQYFQIRFDTIYWIGGVVTSGGDNGNWVTSYRVNYSSDCVLYLFLMESDDTTIKEFPGNTDPYSMMTTYFARPTEIRCLKIYPTGYEGGRAMRLEVLACSNEYTQNLYRR